MQEAPMQIAFRLPVKGWPRAVFSSNYSYDGGTLQVGERAVIKAKSIAELKRGVQSSVDFAGERLCVRLIDAENNPSLQITVGNKVAPREEELHAPTSRSAWIHAWIALLASGAGLVASFLYLQKGEALQDPWSLKMSYHMGAWHLLLTATLFPASVWGQRLGIRSVQVVSLLFFLIHGGIALANMSTDNAQSGDDPAIALLNGLSGVLFLVSAVYGNRAYADMDPVMALKKENSRHAHEQEHVSLRVL
ncbi:MAG: hypothetical protein R3C68_14640 [Myxococcota bacterium]